MIAPSPGASRRGPWFRPDGLAAVLFLTLAVANPASARTVPYPAKMADIYAAADEQGISGPFSDTPGPGHEVILLETPRAADHRVLIASHYCQAYHIDNPVSALLQEMTAAASPAPSTVTGVPDGPTLSLRILSGSTVLRCMGKGDLETICKNRVRLTAEASFTRADGTLGKAPIIAEIERNGRVGGFCGHIARFTGIVTREAVIDLVLQARRVSSNQG